jgi:hypothetical protein
MVGRPFTTILSNIMENAKEEMMAEDDYIFGGFDELKSNFVQIPHVLIDEVLMHVRPSVSVLVLATMRHTVGVLIHKDGSRKKEWFTTMRHLTAATGIRSVNTAKLAIWEARQMGLVVYEEITDEKERGAIMKREGLYGARGTQALFSLRPRWRGDWMDFPEEPRPPG